MLLFFNLANIILKGECIMNLRIVNLRTYTPVPGEVLIKVDRSSPVGNKFHMKNESMRDEVCDKYKTYFRCRIQEDTHLHGI